MASCSPSWLAFVLAAAGCASAGGGPGEAERSWEERERVAATLMPVAWRASARGDSLVRDVPASFDEGEDPGTTWGGRVEMRSEDVGFFLEGFHAAVSFRDPGVEFDARYGVYDLGAALRILGAGTRRGEREPGEGGRGTGRRPAVDVDLDALALVRAHFLGVATRPAGAFESTSESAAWADLVFGVRGAVVLAGRLSAFGRIDGGGMAVDAWRSRSFNAEAGVHLRITENLGAMAAYRWFRAFVEDGRPETVSTPFGADVLDSDLDVRLEGPWVGIVLEF